ncbi:hypothetical protein CDAR_576711 [Caerostris darwini]|uniref:Uncharacterized protein n=1 Tax=Caerostris darwini TaxID=1538125 RepID=A0AAV4W195_9ARAC|nr:hypothetical protein CDAR_576711 [Caerostris darwini]
MRTVQSPVINKGLDRGSLGFGEQNRTKEQRAQESKQMQILLNNTHSQYDPIGVISRILQGTEGNENRPIPIYGITHICPTIQLESSAGYCRAWKEMRVVQSPVINKGLGRGSLGFGEENRTKRAKSTKTKTNADVNNALDWRASAIF